jgi:antitoxin ParD1/3/4
MNKNTSITLGTHFADFVDAQLENGRFATVSEVVRAGLRLLEEHETKVRMLQEALIAGEQSGEPREFDKGVFLARMHQKHVG